jgi:hypothetical protein
MSFHKKHALITLTLIPFFSCGKTTPKSTPEQNADVAILDEGNSLKILESFPEILDGYNRVLKKDKDLEKELANLGLDQFSSNPTQIPESLNKIEPDGTYFPTASASLPTPKKEFELLALDCDIQYVTTSFGKADGGMKIKPLGLNSVKKPILKDKTSEKQLTIKPCTVLVTNEIFKNKSEVELPLLSTQTATYQADSLCIGNIKGECIHSSPSDFTLTQEEYLSRLKETPGFLKNLNASEYLIIQYKKISDGVQMYTTTGSLYHPGRNQYISQSINQNLESYVTRLGTQASMKEFLKESVFADCDMVALKNTIEEKESLIVFGHKPRHQQIVHAFFQNHAWNFEAKNSRMYDSTPEVNSSFELYYDSQMLGSHHEDIRTSREARETIKHGTNLLQITNNKKMSLEEFLFSVSPLGDLNDPSILEKFDLQVDIVPMPVDSSYSPVPGLGAKGQLVSGSTALTTATPGAERTYIGPRWIISEQKPSLGFKSYRGYQNFIPSQIIFRTFTNSYGHNNVLFASRNFQANFTRYSYVNIPLEKFKDEDSISINWDSDGNTPAGSWSGTFAELRTKLGNENFKQIEVIEAKAFILAK